MVYFAAVLTELKVVAMQMTRPCFSHQVKVYELTRGIEVAAAIEKAIDMRFRVPIRQNAIVR